MDSSSLPPSDAFEGADTDQDYTDTESDTPDSDSGTIGISAMTQMESVPHTPPRARPAVGLEAFHHLTSSGPRASTPIIGSPETKKTIRRQKGYKKRRETLAAGRAAQEQNTADAMQAQQQYERGVFTEVLDLLQRKKVKLGAFLLYVFDPQNKTADLGTERWVGFLSNKTGLETLLGYWTSKATPLSIRDRMKAWAMQYVGDIVEKEGESVTRSGILRTTKTPITRESVMAFDMDDIYQRVKQVTRTMSSLLDRFSTTKRQQKAASGPLAIRKERMIASAALGLLHARSRANNLPSNVMGLYLYATGAQRQTMSVLSHLGFSPSYPSLVGRGDATERTEPDTETPGVDNATTEPDAKKGAASVSKRRNQLKSERSHRRPPGLLPQLSRSCMRIAREIAKTGLYMCIYDNINLVFKAAEQILGRKDSQENGTCVTVVELHGAKKEDLRLADAQAAFQHAPPLSFKNLIFSRAEEEKWHDLLVHAVLWIIVNHGSFGFERFHSQLEADEPKDTDRIALHKTRVFPISAHDIDESSITGNIEVVNTILKDLGIDQDTPEFEESVRFFAGDQLSIARLRSIMFSRAGHERGSRAWHWPVTVLGLFHSDMAATHGVLETHWGRPGAPASLSFHNTTLDRKPIVLTSMPPYRVCRDLVNVSLYARVLHCLLLVSGESDLEHCAASIKSWDQLKTYAKAICTRYASTRVVESLRNGRRMAEAKKQKSAGDMVFENGALFMRDALELRAFSLATKAGRSGDVLLSLRRFALSYRGAGHTKYAHEMLHIVHNMQCVWPAPLRAIVLNNWLVNTTGFKNSWIPVDLLQEHLNFWIKRFYAAQGSNASWDWLQMLSPCVEILRQLANQIHDTLGSRQGKRHAPIDLSRDIAILMRKLNESAVYVPEEGRRLDDEDEVVVDIVTRGLQALTEGNPSPLADYNDTFCTLQRRRRIKPLQELDDAATMQKLTSEPVHDLSQTDSTEHKSAGRPVIIDEANESEEEGEQSVQLEEMDENQEPPETCSFADEGDVDLYPDEQEVESEDEFDSPDAALMDDSEGDDGDV